MQIQIIDCNVGNIHSLENAIHHLGHTSRVVSDPSLFSHEENMIIPGVGAFEPSVSFLRERGFPKLIEKNLSSGLSLLGICLGMQLLLETSYERGKHTGLSLISGTVKPFAFENSAPEKLKIPHMGWNQLHFTKHRDAELFLSHQNPETAEKIFCYFVHSYHVELADPSITLATTDHGLSFCSFFKKDRIYGLQFHPEKSQRDGLHILKKIFSLW